MSGIRFDGVTKTYGGVVAVHDVSFSIEPGTYHCVLGPNGSGKSTLIRLALGLTRPDEGSVTTPDGVVGCGFESPNFFDDLSVYENIDIFADMVGADDDWSQTLSEELGLAPVLDRPAGDLSSGYARKLDLMLALMKEPDFLFLDEALDTLDDVSEERFLDLLERYAGEDRTVVVSTHYVPSFEPYLDRMTVMHDGDVVRDESGEALGSEGDLRSRYVDTVLERDASE
jgi:ABC-type multidrug transport system ATPase subunit